MKKIDKIIAYSIIVITAAGLYIISLLKRATESISRFMFDAAPYFVVLIIGIGLGYAWRMDHESKKWLHAHKHAQEQLLKDIRHEAGKGHNFNIKINETDVAFMPIKGGKVRVMQ